MNVSHVIFATSLIVSTISFSQEPMRCGSHRAIDYQESRTPGYKKHVEDAFEYAKKHKEESLEKSDTEVTIPVVFHIVFSTPEQNLSDDVIQNQIAILNEDFQRLNADTSEMRSVFNAVKGSTNIHFELAQLDPNGNPTTGITRTSTATQSFGTINLLLGNFADVEKVKSSTQGGKSPWNPNKYLNIWVCNMSLNIGGNDTPLLLGYGTPPIGLPNWPSGSTPNLVDGVVIQYQCVGSNNPNELEIGGDEIDVVGRTVTHEVGHYLGLRHIWGDGDCTQQDGINDTPNALAQSEGDCNLSKNTCVDNIFGMDLPDMVENFMDYSAETCQNTFTQGQAELMCSVLQNQRFSLVNINSAVIHEIKNETDARVYPVPACTELNLVTSEPMQGTIKVVDINGATMSQQRMNNSDHNKIDVCDLKNGVYFVQIESSDAQTKTLKFVKQ